jgi:hypothetical protein
MHDDDDKPDGDYEVGYGRPPKHTRFKPGQSGNPRGRKRKSKELNQLIEAELDKFITVTEDGKRKRIRKRDGLVTQFVNRGINGDPKSLQLLIAHLEKHREVEPFTPTEADDAALLAALSAPDKKEDDHGDR